MDGFIIKEKTTSQKGNSKQPEPNLEGTVKFISGPTYFDESITLTSILKREGEKESLLLFDQLTAIQTCRFLRRYNYGFTFD